ncbi:MAG: type II and III secretion system protein family protein [Pseudomonadota bacterium]
MARPPTPFGRWATALAIAACLALGPGLAAAQAPAGSPELPSELIALPVAKSQVLRLPDEVRDVMVANPEIADVVMRSPAMAFLVGRKIGDTNVYFFNARGQQVRHIVVRVEMDLTALKAALKQLIPNEKIEATAANQSVVLTGSVGSATAADSARQVARQFVQSDETVINLLQVRGDQQVLLRVRVAEMSRQVVKELGLSTNAVFQFGSPRLQQFDITSGIARADQFGTIAATIRFNALERLTSTIQALERTGLVKILAEPTLTAVSGETANFLVGGEFPVPVPQQQTVTIQFKQFGIRLNFTPVVLSAGFLSLKIATEVSQLTERGQVVLGGFTIPALTVRRAETTVEMPSGGSLVIAGLLQNDIRNTMQGFPVLKDIPILGALFRSAEFQRDETELVIAVTPLLVRSADPNEIAFPTDGFGAAHDFDMFVLGRLHAVYKRPGPSPGTLPVRGPIGFILE